MSDNIYAQIAALDKDQRALFERLLREEDIDLGQQVLRQQAASSRAPLSSAQRQLWLVEQINPGEPTYNVPIGFALTGPLRLDALEAALAKIIERHEPLRTAFVLFDAHPQQEVRPPWPLRLTIADLEGLPHAEQEALASELGQEEARRPFDLTSGRMLRGLLVRLSETSHQLYLTLHHIASDAWSVGVLQRELVALYEAACRGAALNLPPLPVRYSDFARWEQAHLGPSRLAELTKWWQKWLTDAPSLTQIPTDRPRPAVLSSRGGRLNFTFSAAERRSVRRLAKEAQVSTFVVALSLLAALVYRLTGQTDLVMGSPMAARQQVELAELIGFLVHVVPIRIKVAAASSFRELLGVVREAVLASLAQKELPFERMVDALKIRRDRSRNPIFQISIAHARWPMDATRMGELYLQPLAVHNGTAKFDLALDIWEAESFLAGTLDYNSDLYDPGSAARLLGRYRHLLAEVTAEPERPLVGLSVLPDDERAAINRWADGGALPAPAPDFVRVFDAQVARTPDAVAFISGGDRLTYRELATRANQLARRLQQLGAGPETLVGLCMHRSLDLGVGILGIAKAGAAWLPLDPTWPAQRLTAMLADARPLCVVTSGEVNIEQGATVHLARDADLLAAMSADPVESGAGPANLAYVLYTSGSTGRPNGVMVERRNLDAFLLAMDQQLGRPTPLVWLAVSSVSFDISILELLWPLRHGGTVVVAGHTLKRQPAARALDFSLFFFASQGGDNRTDKYRLLFEGARFADEHGFAAVWTPERHFDAFGGLFPNPAVTGAAVAAVTRRLSIRAGSIVAPLHHPLRIAEEWSVVDNISGGRVGLAFASGWHATDFVLAPTHYLERHGVMWQSIETVLRLFGGEAVRLPSGSGSEVAVQLYPRPLQKAPPVWITAAGNPETFRRAGEKGFFVLTHLLGQGMAALAEKIAIYREARRQAGWDRGHVSVMLHTYLGDDEQQVRQEVRGPFTAYLRSSFDLTRQLFSVLGMGENSTELSAAEIDYLIDQGFERYVTRAGLIGTPKSCLRMVDQLAAIGADEIACLIDFGVDETRVLEGLRRLDALRAEVALRARHQEADLPALITRHRVTHLQCTPSLLSILLDDPESRAALGTISTLLVGGEALPPALAARVGSGIRLLNMYGPTETTIWSSAASIDPAAVDVSIGQPLAGTMIQVLDERSQQVPIGVVGELCIGGAGVARGYLGRSEQTAERFVDLPWGRLYRTGDRVRWRADGQLEFLGRLDQQIKLRGFRIELGEIEAKLREHPQVRDAAVVVRTVQGEPQLQAYIVPSPNAYAAASAEQVQQWQMVWEQTYSAMGSRDPATMSQADPTLQTVGWRSSFSGEPIPSDQMREWADQTAARIRSLHPRRILEIGVGTGMLLQRLIDSTEAYWGLDIPSAVLSYVQSILSPAASKKVRLLPNAAHELSEIPDGSFDVVVLNSVVQYFPSADYLKEVLRLALNKLSHGGTVFLGDVRDLSLLRAFHTEVQVCAADGATSMAALLPRVEQRLAEDGELLLDPGFFFELPRTFPRIRAVRVLRKRGRAQHEMNRYRYDVILQLGRPFYEAPPTVLAAQGRSRSELLQLADGAAGPLVLTDVADGRVANALHMMKAENLTAGAARDLLSGGAASPPDSRLASLDPEDLALAFEQRGWHVDLSAARSAHPGSIDLVLYRQQEPPAWPDAMPVDGRPLASDPLKQKVTRALIAGLRNWLQEALPEYMMPRHFTILQALPMTPNGKVDRRALPAPAEELTPPQAVSAPPRTPLEEKLAQAWAAVLGQERVGIYDNFFEQGGHSLAATQLVLRLRDILGVKLALSAVFEAPTVAAMAERLADKR